jgi:hypothetical protein
VNIQHDARVRIDWAPRDGFEADPPLLVAYVDGTLVASAARMAGTQQWVVLNGFHPTLSHRSRDHQVVDSEAEARQVLAETAGGEAQ